MNQAERVLKTIELIVGHEWEGVRNKNLAAALETSAVNVSRDLKLMMKAGFVETLPGRDGLYRLAPKAILLFAKFNSNMQSINDKVEKLKTHYTGE